MATARLVRLWPMETRIRYIDRRELPQRNGRMKTMEACATHGEEACALSVHTFTPRLHSECNQLCTRDIPAAASRAGRRHNSRRRRHVGTAPGVSCGLRRGTLCSRCRLQRAGHSPRGAPVPAAIPAVGLCSSAACEACLPPAQAPARALSAARAPQLWARIPSSQARALPQPLWSLLKLQASLAQSLFAACSSSEGQLAQVWQAHHSPVIERAAALRQGRLAGPCQPMRLRGNTSCGCVQLYTP
jgi:hypothetical protein